MASKTLTRVWAKKKTRRETGRTVSLAGVREAAGARPLLVSSLRSAGKPAFLEGVGKHSHAANSCSQS